jgi:hypothetical protein
MVVCSAEIGIEIRRRKLPSFSRRPFAGIYPTTTFANTVCSTANPSNSVDPKKLPYRRRKE